MIRKYIKADGDNNVIRTTESFTTTGTSGTVTITTPFNVSWAAVVETNLSGSGGTGGSYEGPFSYAGDGVTTTKTIRDADVANDPAVEYADGSLALYLNGQLLLKGTEYQEDSDNFTYSLINIGTTGLTSIPTSSDTLAVFYRSNTSGSGGVGTGGLIFVSQIYPDLENEIEITYQNLTSGLDIEVILIYQ